MRIGSDPRTSRQAVSTDQPPHVEDLPADGPVVTAAGSQGSVLLTGGNA